MRISDWSSDVCSSDLIEIVETPVPLPLPGQLQPPPSVKPKAGPPTARVDAANRAATKEPISSGDINAVQVSHWTEGALHRLYAAHERDRKSVGTGKRVEVRVDPGGFRGLKNNKNTNIK